MSGLLTRTRIQQPVCQERAERQPAPRSLLTRERETFSARPFPVEGQGPVALEVPVVQVEHAAVRARRHARGASRTHRSEGDSDEHSRRGDKAKAESSKFHSGVALVKVRQTRFRRVASPSSRCWRLDDCASRRVHPFWRSNLSLFQRLPGRNADRDSSRITFGRQNFSGSLTTVRRSRGPMVYAAGCWSRTLGVSLASQRPLRVRRPSPQGRETQGNRTMARDL